MRYFGSISGLVTTQSPGVLFFDEILDGTLPDIKSCLENKVLVKARTCSGSDNKLNPIRGQASDTIYYYTYLKHGQTDTVYSDSIYRQMITCTELGGYTSAYNRSTYLTASRNARTSPGTLMLNPFDDDHKLYSPLFSFGQYLNTTSVSVSAIYVISKPDNVTANATLDGYGRVFVGGTAFAVSGQLSGLCDYIDFPTYVSCQDDRYGYWTPSYKDGLMYTDDKIADIEKVTLTSALICAKEFCMKLIGGIDYTVDQDLTPGYRPFVKWSNAFDPVNL